MLEDETVRQYTLQDKRMKTLLFTLVLDPHLRVNALSCVVQLIREGSEELSEIVKQVCFLYLDLINR